MGYGEKRGHTGLSGGLTLGQDIGEKHEPVVRDWRRRISDNLAYALLAYTVLQILVTMKQLKEISHTTLPYLALVVLVAGIIPAARAIERHWERMDDITAHDPAEGPRFQRDRLIIWGAAIGLPIILALVARGIHALTA